MCASPKARAGAKRPLLDTSNQLETSLLFWLQTPDSPRDEYAQKKHLQDVLEVSIGKIVAEIEHKLDDLQSWEPGPELERELERTRKELKSWCATWARLSNCQSEWIGYRATCCKSAVAIPIGCNHRGCFLCNSARLAKYRDRVKTLLGRLTHPVLLTLTVPNTAKLSKRTFSALRAAFNVFKKKSPWILGGIYALETTYRKPHQAEKPWHTHAHALVDSAYVIPKCSCGSCNRCGRWNREKSVCRCGGHTSWRWHRYDDSGNWAKSHAADCAFIRFFRRVEFDWFLATGGRKQRWSDAGFDRWLARTESCNWRSEFDREQWNRSNRRTVYVQRCDDREKAVFEIVKYVTKAAEFVDQPQAIKEFFTATRGARMLQTFGSWYGLKLDPDVNQGMPSQENSWSGLACECGENCFERIGRLDRLGVVMEKSGQWKPRNVVYERGSP